MIAIDLGSNTLRAIEIACETKSFIKSFERMVKTADRLIETGEISSQALDRIVEGLLEMQKIWDFGKEKVLATTTAAMRMAKNRDAALAYIEAKTGVRFTVIDAEKEAFYTQLAVSRRMQSLGWNDPFLLLDVGGGSTELIYCDHQNYRSQSIDVGIVTLSQSHETKERMIEAIYKAFEPLKSFVDDLQLKPRYLVCTAGTPTTIAAFKQGMMSAEYDPLKINGTRLTLQDLSEQLHRLMALDEAERIRFVGVGRDLLIQAGVEILIGLYKILGFETAIVIDDGLREGLALDGCA